MTTKKTLPNKNKNNAKHDKQIRAMWAEMCAGPEETAAFAPFRVGPEGHCDDLLAVHEEEVREGGGRRGKEGERWGGWSCVKQPLNQPTPPHRVFPPLPSQHPQPLQPPNLAHQVKRLSGRLEAVRPILKLIARRHDFLQERDEVGGLIGKRGRGGGGGEREGGSVGL